LDQLRLRDGLAGLAFDEGAGDLAPCRIGPGDHGDALHRRVLGQRFLDLDRRNVLAAGDDDVLGPVLELNVAVGMLDAEVARMEPAAGEGRFRG